MRGLQLCAYSLWLNEQEARAAFATGDVDSAVDSMGMIQLIARHSKHDSLRRSCISALDSLNVDYLAARARRCGTTQQQGALV